MLPCSADFSSTLLAVCVLCGLCLQTTNERGIIISAGGPYYLPQALVLLRVLRHHLNCTLPVELFWVDSNEMDDDTFKVGIGRRQASLCCSQ
jgi:hypothetical protein